VKNAPADNRLASRLPGLLHCLSANLAVLGKGGSMDEKPPVVTRTPHMFFLAFPALSFNS
jgi:hypothetical protein